jgi:uncharacterized protein YqeY
MAALFARLQGDLTGARKAQDKALTLLLGTIVSEIKNRALELTRDLTDDDTVDVLRKQIKRRRESADMYEKGARAELAAVELTEMKVLETYLPAAPSSDELRAAIQAAIAGGATNVGALMGKIMPQFKGKIDGGVINAIAREELARAG